MAGRSTALTEKTEAVLLGLVDRGAREKAAGLRPAFPASSAPPAPPTGPPPAIPSAPPAEDIPAAAATRERPEDRAPVADPNARTESPEAPSSGRAEDGRIHLLIGRPQSIDDVLAQFTGPEIREDHPVHRGFYLNPEHVEMIEAIAAHTGRGRSAIVRSAIALFHILLEDRGLLGPAGQTGKDRGRGRNAPRPASRTPAA